MIEEMGRTYLGGRTGRFTMTCAERQMSMSGIMLFAAFQPLTLVPPV